MNIAYIVPGLKNKGPVLVVRELVNQMIANGNTCSVFYFDENPEIVFPCPTLKISFFQKIDFDNFEVIHTHGIRPDAYVFCHKAVKSKTKFVSTLHNYVLRDLSFQYNRLIAYVCGNLWMMLLLKRHDVIVTLSKDAMHYYTKWFSYNRLTYVYNTRTIETSVKLNHDEESQLVNFKNDFQLIGVNALLTYRKGIDLLIQALVRLPNYKLFIVGDGKAKGELLHIAETFGVADRVFFAGYRNNAYRYLIYYDVFAIPSRSEGFPLSLLEASIVGLPVVCSNIVVFKELFTDEEVAFFELEDIESLAKAILRATNNNKISKSLNIKYMKEYCPEIFYKNYMRVYQSLL